MIKTQLAKEAQFKKVRAGYTTSGTPSNINVIRSMKGSLARRIALAGPYRKQIKPLEDELAQLKASPSPDQAQISRLENEIAELREKIKKVHNPSGSQELGMFIKDLIMGFKDLKVSGHSDQGLKNCIIVRKGDKFYDDVFEDFKGRGCNLSWWEGE